MNRFLKTIIICLLTVGLGLGSMTASGVVYDAYKLTFGEARWQVKYNNLVTAVQTEITSLGTLIANWVTTVDSLTLIQTAPTYSDASTFTLTGGDYSAVLTPGKRLVADCGADGLRPNTVVSCTYAAPSSTVVVATANLTNNLAAVSYYATRNGVNTYGSGDIVAAEFGAPSWVNLQAAVALANSSGRRLLLTPGTWPVDDTLSITAPLCPVPGAVLGVVDTKTLTASGVDAGLHQAFSCAGSGKVIINQVEAVKSAWFGDDPTGAADSSAALNLAIYASRNGCKAPVVVGPGTFNLTAATVYFYKSVLIKGAGQEATVFISTANAPVFGSGEDLSSRAGVYGFDKLLSDCTINTSTNANDIDQIYIHDDFNMQEITNVAFVGNSAATQNGLHVYHTNAAARANWMYHNRIIGCDFKNVKSLSGGCVWFEGDGATERRANNNEVRFCRFDDYRTGVRIAGIGNELSHNTFNVPDAPVFTTGGGTDFRVHFSDGYGNGINNNWFEGGLGVGLDPPHVLIYSETTAGVKGGIWNALGQNASLVYDYQTVDLNTDRQYTVAADSVSFVDSDTLIIGDGTDHTSYFAVGRRVYVYQGVDGWATAKVNAVSYSAPDTTIDLDDTILTANLESVASSGYGAGIAWTPRPILNGIGKFYIPHLTTGELTSGNITLAEGSYFNIGNTKVLTATVSTTDATVTSLYLVTLPEGYSWHYEADVVAWQTGGAAGTEGDSAIYKRTCGAKRLTGGAAALVGSVVDLMTQEDGALAACNVTFNVSANLLRLRVTGEADKNITWHATIKAVKSGN